MHHTCERPSRRGRCSAVEQRDLHLVKKALAIAVLVMEGQSGPLQSSNDKLDMKLLHELLTNEAELKMS
jgi:hypothetical protein